jgi:hypothetical protein
VLSDGSLLVVFVQIPASTATGLGPFAMYATRSRNHGRSWSRPVLITTGTYTDVVDPKTRTVYEPHCCVYSLAAGPRRTAHLAWTTNSSTTAGAVHVVSTFDGGRSWPASVVLDRPAQALEATVAATRRTLAVTWYDFSGDQPAGQVRPTTLWLARSGDGGATWTIERLAGPFDIASAPPVGAGYLGDFQSLVPVRGGFQAAFTVARPLAVVGSSDIFRAFIPDLPPPSP